jgi:hypothetical protein
MAGGEGVKTTSLVLVLVALLSVIIATGRGGNTAVRRGRVVPTSGRVAETAGCTTGADGGAGEGGGMRGLSRKSTSCATRRPPVSGSSEG